MDRMPSRAEVKRIKERYKVGTRIQLTSTMEDKYSPIESGAKGTVNHVDDIGTLFIDWDNGRSLGLIPGVDKFKIID